MLNKRSRNSFISCKLYIGDPDIRLLDVSSDFFSTRSTAMATPVKLPEFWEASPATWFAQTEAQFALRDITDDATKYYHVVSALSSSTAVRVESLIVSPPRANKYDAIKTHLLKTFQPSDAERADRLFSLQGLGDSKPSELMDKMLNMMGPNKPDFLFIHLFLRQLPSQVRAALANTKTTDCRALAAEADKFFLAGQKQHVAVLSSALPVSPPPQDTMVAAAAAAPRRGRDTGLCYFHARFGSNAKRCRPPCSFATSGNESAGTR